MPLLFLNHGMIKYLLLLASHNNPSASAVATDSAVANVSALVALPCVPAVLVVSAVTSVPAAAVLLTAVYVQGVPALAKVSAGATVSTAVDALSSIGVSSVSCVRPCCCFCSCRFWLLYCGWHPLLLLPPCFGFPPVAGVPSVASDPVALLML